MLHNKTRDVISYMPIASKWRLGRRPFKLLTMRMLSFICDLCHLYCFLEDNVNFCKYFVSRAYKSSKRECNVTRNIRNFLLLYFKRLVTRLTASVV
jgi:hypothetical protein